jgi:large conductance mechanosensitive channel
VVIYFLVRALTRLTPEAKAPTPEVETKVCPYCISDVPLKATRCPYCTSDLTEGARTALPAR